MRLGPIYQSVGQPSALARLRAGGAVAAAVAGISATTFPIAPTIQYHAGTSTKSLRADSTITGYISGTTLTVTALSGFAILEGQTITAGAAAGTSIVKGLTGAGGTGTYQVSASQTVYSAGTPGSFTIPNNQVVSLSDLKGYANLTSADNNGPILMTDALGRKFMRFIAPLSFIGSWLRNLSITSLDTYNMTWIATLRIHDASTVSTIVGIGSKELATGTLAALGWQKQFPNLLGQNPTYNAGSPPSNINKMLTGTQLQVLGTATATSDGVGGGGSTNAARIIVNDQSAALTVTGARYTGKTGLEIGKHPGQNTNGSQSQYAFMDLYELAGWVTGEMGNIAAMPARASAAAAAAMSNFGIPTITDSLILLGDSRTVNGANYGSGAAANGAGYNFATLVTEPGSAVAVPASTRVINLAISGQGVGRMATQLSVTASSNNTWASPLLASMMLGGGHDNVGIISGINDYQAPLWPTVNFAAGTTGIADEMYNGTAFTASFTATVPNNSVSMTMAGMTGTLANGSVITVAGGVGGLATTTGGTTSATLNVFQTPALSAVAATATLPTYQNIVQTLLARGYKVVWGAEMSFAVSDGAATTELRSKIMNNALADANAGAGQTYDGKLRVFNMSLITVGGSAIFGANFAGVSSTNTYYVDGVHATELGKRAQTSGGDTPQYGYATVLKASIAA